MTAIIIEDVCEAEIADHDLANDPRAALAVLLWWRNPQIRSTPNIGPVLAEALTWNA